VKSAKVILPIILVLVGLGAGFFGGIQYRNYQINKARGSFAAGGTGAAGTFQRFTGSRTGGTGAAGARGGAGGAVTGSVLSMDASSLTVKLADGSTKIVLFGGSTTYSNTAAAAQSDLKVGNNVMVFGTPNSDGSVTATNVQINPMSFRPQGSPMPTP
jgi:hypothetical protein